MVKQETIICAAIHYHDLPSPPFNAVNVAKGIVICGHRHVHCISTMKALSALRTATFAEDGTGKHEQGFLTNLNRFVDRQEGWNIAIAANQLNDRVHTIGTLYSEDIY